MLEDEHVAQLVARLLRLREPCWRHRICRCQQALFVHKGHLERSNSKARITKHSSDGKHCSIMKKDGWSLHDTGLSMTSWILQTLRDLAEALCDDKLLFE